MKHFACTGLSLLFLASACEKGQVVPAPESYQFQVPAGFPQPVFDTENTMTTEGIALGRMLFYDVRLSGNNQVSCASCHDPKRAFTDGTALSRTGVSGTELHRHAPALFNLAWAGNGLFWDGGSTNLESQAFGPLTAADEMQQDLVELVQELNAIPAYVTQFDAVFQNGISSANVVKALAQFQRTLVSATSRYDRFKRREAGSYLSEDEQKGMLLVAQKCQGCHAGELFTDNGFHNNGIDSDFSNDALEGIYQGRFRVSYQPEDLGKFKTPSLRNVALTAPYMHDGRFADLDAVLTHYSSGIQSSPTLDTRLPVGGLKLTNDERRQIKAFLNALTDETFVSNPRLHKP